LQPKLLVFAPVRAKDDLLTGEVVERLNSFAEPKIVIHQGDIPRDEFIGLFAGIDGVITSWDVPRIDRAVLEKAGRLKIIAHAAGQVRQYLDEELFDLKPDIVVCNAANVMAAPVAEHTLCVTLACLRHLGFFRDWVARGDQWWGYNREKNVSLLHKKVGIIGMGQIAREFIKLARPFMVEFLVFSRHLSSEDAEREGLAKSSLEEIFSTCEVITLSAADTPGNRRMVGRDLLSRIKPGAVFVNNARGSLVDEQALIEELETGRFMAAVDVTDPEPPAADNRLRRLPNVLLTPHIGGPTPDQRVWMMKEAVDNVENFFRGEPVRNIIDRGRFRYMA